MKVKLFRETTRKGKKQEIELKNGVLECSCREPVYVGVPCRHLIAVVGKVEDMGYERLPFNSRWQKDFFVEEKYEEPKILSEKDKDDLKKENEEEFKTEEVNSLFFELFFYF